MPGQQALQLTRTVAFAALPHELTIVVDKDDPLYDRSIHEPLREDFVLSIATHGVQQNLKVRERDGKNVVIIGKQRTKAGLALNHLCGAHAYKGTLAPVLAFIKEHKTSDFGRRLVELVGAKGIRLVVTPLAPAGGAAKAQRVMAAENGHRRRISDAENADKAQRMKALEVSDEDIAQELGVPLSSIKRLLKLDPDAPPKQRKPRTTVIRPGSKKLAAVRDALADDDEEAAKGAWVAVRWALGEATSQEMRDIFPELREVAL